MKKRILSAVVFITCIHFLTMWTRMPAVMGQRSFSPSIPVSRILHVRPDLAKMPVNFIPNQGQLDELIDYYIQGKDKTIYFGAEGLTFVLTKANEGRIKSDQMNSPRLPTDHDGAEDLRWVVKLDFVGANNGVNPVGMDKTGARISYFYGETIFWKTGLSTYSRIIYENLWPGIDLVYMGTMDQLKYEFIVHPGADPSRIRLAYRGASSVFINNKGSLVVSTPSGGFEDGLPVAYQEHLGKRESVPLAYEIGDNSGGRNAVTYGFSVGEYDQTKPLILDPVILIYCGYVGGPSYDYGYGITADIFGNSYISGYTYSMGIAFPVTVGPDLTFNRGSVDAFVAKLNASGTGLDYCGYIGGSGDDYGYAVAVDVFGNAYITGYTSSTESTFPLSVGPDLTHNGFFDIFVAKVNAEGTALDYCGYIGGSGYDYGRSIAVNTSGQAYITGYTSSTEDSFPVNIGPDLSYNGGYYDAFVAKLNASGTALDYCGYIGGSGDDYGYGIAVDILGSAYITGHTSSTESTFPVSVGPDLTHNGLFDIFVAKVNAEGTALDYCGYIGGSGYDSGRSIAVHASGQAYITGYSSSKEDSFPVNAGPDLSHNGGYYDAFVAKLNASGTALDYCGYIGGLEYDSGTAIVVDGWGYAYLTGYTSSTEDTFPVKVGPDLTHNGSFDAFVAKVDSTGLKLAYCGYIGGSEADLGMGIALDVDGSGNVYMTGNTYSTESSFPVGTGPDLAHNGNRDGFVVKIYENSIFVTKPNGGESWQVESTQDITWITGGTVGNVKIEYSTNNGTNWIEIIASTENDGTYTWIVPDAVSTECLVRISEADDGDPSDTSDAVFSITALTFPLAMKPATPNLI